MRKCPLAEVLIRPDSQTGDDPARRLAAISKRACGEGLRLSSESEARRAVAEVLAGQGSGRVCGTVQSRF